MSSPKERGTLLDIWMFILFAANIGVLIWYLGGYLTGFSLNGLVWTFLECVYLIWNLICLSFLFKWKKLGFFGFWAGILLVLALNLYFGVGALAFLGLVGVGILSLMLRPKWKLLD
jgi:hypothetical protein